MLWVYVGMLESVLESVLCVCIGVCIVLKGYMVVFYGVYDGLHMMMFTTHVCTQHAHTHPPTTAYAVPVRFFGMILQAFSRHPQWGQGVSCTWHEAATAHIVPASFSL